MTTATLPFSFTTIDQCVVVIKFTDPLTSEAWPRYQAAFRRVYDRYPHFVLIFDLTDMSVPDFDVIQKKRQLILEMKARSCRQLLAAIVVTSLEPLRTLIQAIVKYGGQASPFYAFTDKKEAAETAARLAMIIKKVPNSVPKTGAWKNAVVWGRLGHAARMTIAVFAFVRNLRHFVTPK